MVSELPSCYTSFHVNNLAPGRRFHLLERYARSLHSESFSRHMGIQEGRGRGGCHQWQCSHHHKSRGMKSLYKIVLNLNWGQKYEILDVYYYSKSKLTKSINIS